ncbi:MAG: RNase adapter RapZ [Chloroflexi bacterium]|nr:MAG: RNase adapter RapZ [Chloroflexota bacterium]
MAQPSCWKGDTTSGHLNVPPPRPSRASWPVHPLLRPAARARASPIGGFGRPASAAILDHDRRAGDERETSVARGAGTTTRGGRTTRRSAGTRSSRSAPAARPAPPPSHAAQPPATAGSVVILSGLSGAGKSQASKLFEDLGYACIDNLPPDLLDAFLSLRDANPDRYRNAALVLDIRVGDPAPAIARARTMLAGRGLEPLVIFLEASDAVLVSRFAETRRRHPLGARTGVQASIAEERFRLAGARSLADHIVDTSGLSIGQLKERIRSLVPREAAAEVMSVEVITFGFKFGIPLEADLVFDVRFLTNPYWVPDLKRLSGLEAPVRDYVLGQPGARRFLELVMELLELTLPAYRAEGKSRLVVALGCTGGYHRSIVLAEELARRLEERTEASVSVFHRELER